MQKGSDSLVILVSTFFLQRKKYKSTLYHSREMVMRIMNYRQDFL
jgi:hypothetical protein